MRIIAIKESSAGAVDAVLIDTERPEDPLVEWWGGYASQAVSESVHPEDIASWEGWRQFEMDLPADWEEGYLRSVGGEIEFVLGTPPKRTKP